MMGASELGQRGLYELAARDIFNFLRKPEYESQVSTSAPGLAGCKATALPHARAYRDCT
jgi:hypothetical protein